MSNDINPSELAHRLFRETLALTKHLLVIEDAKPYIAAFGKDIATHATSWLIFFLAYILNGKNSLDLEQVSYINAILGKKYSAEELNNILSKGVRKGSYDDLLTPPPFLILGKRINNPVYHELFDNVEVLGYTAILLDDREEPDELARMEEIIAPIRQVLNTDNIAEEEAKTKDVEDFLIDDSPDDSKLENVVEKESRKLNRALAGLNSMIGLDAVKKEVASLVNFVKYQQHRKRLKLPIIDVSLHLVFTGNPGTGKTTVARLIANIYKNLGVLSEGQLVETDRSGLVGEYIGHTAAKVSERVDEAINGVLFIDEAYALKVKDLDRDFGSEAISTLLKLMEDNRDNLAVIVAGYTKEMDAFIKANPGLKSRFNRYIQFDDFNETQLIEIFKALCKKNRYKLSPSARLHLAGKVAEIYENREDTFGNARVMRNLFEQVVQKIADRVSDVANPTKADLTIIEPMDLS